MSTTIQSVPAPEGQLLKRDYGHAEEDRLPEILREGLTRVEIMFSQRQSAVEST